MGPFIRRLVEGEVLSDADMTLAMETMLEGQASEAHMAAFLVALRMRGETVGEIVAAARVLRRHARPIPWRPAGPLLDTCGTGGDGAGSFNISTVAALVVAALGVPVAKHGNRAVSSRSGSADLLEALGVAIEVEPADAARDLEELRIAFLFAPSYHAAVRHVVPVRRALGVRTLFNVLGPLANPAGATHQLLGVYDPALVVPLAEALRDLGSVGAWVVHGEGGVDEVSLHGESAVAVLEGGSITTRTVTPELFGLPRAPVSALRGGGPEENAAIARAVLGCTRSPYRDAVVLNAAAALLVAGRGEGPEDARALAEGALDNGRAARLLDRWVGRNRSPA